MIEGLYHRKNLHLSFYSHEKALKENVYEKFIKMHMVKGSTIYADCFKAYSSLSEIDMKPLIIL
jgi:hypothetical protein